jgi:anti-sigma B factor antagonist
MKISIDKQDNYTIFTLLEPKLNSLIAPEMKTRLALMNSEGERYIIFDMSHIQFVDSAGLSAILVGHRLCNNADGLFILAAPNESVQRLMAISQLTDLLNIADTLEKAQEMVGIEALIDAIEGDEDSDASETSDDEDE